MQAFAVGQMLDRTRKVEELRQGDSSSAAAAESQNLMHTAAGKNMSGLDAWSPQPSGASGAAASSAGPPWT